MKIFSLDDDIAVLSLIENRKLRITDVSGGTGVLTDKLVNKGHVI